MRLVVLGSPDGWYVRDLMRAAAPRHEVICLPFSRLSADVGSHRSCIRSQEVDLGQFDAVLVRTMPPGSLEQVVFRMDALLSLESAGLCVINPARSLETAIDKYLCTVKLRAAGIPVPPTAVCQTVEDAMAAFQWLGADVVIKPVFGSEGRGITRVTDEAIAWRVFKAMVQAQSTIYLQQFVPHQGYDLRLLVIGTDVWAIRRHNPDDWRTNVSRGATAEKFRVGDELSYLGRRAAQATGALLAGVDIVESKSGDIYVLEVNAVPGWRAVSAAWEMDTAAMILTFIESIL
jgi:ribosomal protein S6--L-glutamate ligase